EAGIRDDLVTGVQTCALPICVVLGGDVAEGADHDPDTARRVMVGTFRDVTSEHYTVQRQTALAALNQQLAQADSLDDALLGAIAIGRASCRERAEYTSGRG